MANSILGFDLDQNPQRPGGADSRAEDQALVDRLLLGTDDAFELLIERFQQPVYNLVYRLLNDPSDASDVVQEVFLKIFRNLRQFRCQSSLKTWVYRIAVNEASNHRRWFSRHRRQEVAFDTDEDGAAFTQDRLADPGRSALDLVLDHETRELIEDALSGVNPAFRAAVVLRDIEEMSYEEISDVLQVSLGTVKSRILRGREALRKILADRMQPEPGLSWGPQPMRVKS